MTTEELTRLALQEFARLTPEELEILYDHLGTRAQDELARRIAEEASELWSPAEASGVAPEHWAREYINVTIELFHDQRTAFEMQQFRVAAMAFVDGLGSELRALVCGLLGTTQRNRVASIVAKLALDAIAAGLVEGADRTAAIKKTLEVQLAAHIDDVEATYFADQRRGRSH